MPLLTQSILFPLFSDAIVLLIHILECLLWDMGYEIWVMGLYLGGCSIETMRQGWHFSLSRASFSLFLLFGGVFKSFVKVFLMTFKGFEFGISQSKERVQAFQKDKVMIFREITKFFFF